MPTFKRQLLCILLLSGFCSGCTMPEIKHPITDPEKAKVYSELYGVYRESGPGKGEAVYVHVGAAGKDFPKEFLRIIHISHVNNTEGETFQHLSFVAFVEKFGSAYVLQVPLQNKGKEPTNDFQDILFSGKWDKEKVDGYFFTKFEIKKCRFLFSALSTAFVKEQIELKKLSGKVTTTKEVLPTNTASTYEKSKIVVSAKTKELHKFFEKHIDGELFFVTTDPEGILKRLE